MSIFCALSLLIGMVPPVLAANGNSVSDHVLNNTVTPSGIVLNLFDYWVTPNQNDTDTSTDANTDAYKNAKINKNHQLKFTSENVGVGIGNGGSSINAWTGSKTPRQGIVQPRLQGAYPVLAEGQATGSGSDTTTAESLAYLFDKSTQEGKQTFWNVQGLLQVDSDGYYYYNADNKKTWNGSSHTGYETANFAEFDKNTNRFKLYDSWGVNAWGADRDNLQGQFFPFNSATGDASGNNAVFSGVNGNNKLTHSNIHSKYDAINHYFGMTMTTRFVQRYDGKTTSDSTGKHMTFEFAGDDDVWIFIDGILVCDLGGIHNQTTTSIDFATGKITINDSDAGTLKSVMSPYYSAEENAKNWTDAKDQEGNLIGTFADDTYHTLKLFYLERGGTDSNLAMKFNLAHVPETDGYKVDQYGVPLPGVEFALYAATKNEETGGYDYNERNPLAEGTTDEKGRFVLADGSDASISLNELKQKGVKYLVLRETTTRSGYRPSEDFYLDLEDDDADILLLNDPIHQWRTGSYTQPKEAVYVNPNINFRNSDGTKSTKGVDISEPNNGKMFAVIMRRLDNVGGSEPSNDDGWGIVTGDALKGWHVTAPMDNDIAAVLSVVTNSENKDNYFVFEPCSNGSYMTLLDNCPGDMRNYYFWVEEKIKELEDPTTALKNVGYAIAYYYTEANDIKDATVENTRWVYSAEGANFERQFTATLYIPNVKNYLRVQKVGTDGKPVPGATFSLYEKDDVTITTDEAGAVSYEIKQNAQVYDTAKTKDYYGGSDLKGIAIFPSTRTGLDVGEYYLIETAAPEGYLLNPTPIHVVVDERGVLADAGSENDGVSVSISEGSLVSTMRQFADPDGIDYTLTDVKATKLEGTYVEGTGVVFEDTSVVSHMTVAPEIFDNVTYVNTATGFTQPWSTDTGWLWFRMEQDYDGYSTKENQSVYKENLGNTDITPLFDGRTTVIVQDQAVGSLTVSKTVERAPGSTEVPPDQKFTFEVTLTNGSAPLANTSVELTGGSTETSVAAPIGYTDTTNENGTFTMTLKHGQTYTAANLPVGTSWSVTEQPTEGAWTTRANGVLSATTNGTIAEVGKTYEALFVNTYGTAVVTPAVSNSIIVSKSYTAGSSDASDIQTRFTITAKEPANAPLPEVDGRVVTITGASTGRFGTITFGEPGTYTYLISEVNTGTPGMTYDPAQYEVTYTVAETSPNVLTVTNTTYTRVGAATQEDPAPAQELEQDPLLLNVEGEPESGETPAEVVPEPSPYDDEKGFQFENTYVKPPVEQTVRGALEISKSYKGEVYKGPVSFTLKSADDGVTPTLSRTVSIAGAGEASFGDLTFDKPGTYTYYVSEVDPNVTGMTYDTTQYKVTVTVTETIGVTVDYEQNGKFYAGNEGMIFENEYSSSPEVTPTGSLSIRKTVSGTGADQNGEFTFLVQVGDITGVYDGVSFTNGQATVTVKAGNTVTISGLPEGASYSVAETAASSQGYTVTAQNATGTIVADQTAAVVVNNDKAGSSIITPPDGGGESGGDTPALNRTEHYAYIIGYEDGTLRPAGNISRAEVATIFFRLLRDEVRAEYWCQTNPYSDVARTAWYNNAISTLTNMGIIDGYEDGSFHPNAPITRAELTKIAAGFFADQRITKPYDGRFSDVSGKEWFAAALQKAIEEGLIEGYEDGTFGPNRNITRAECCTIINRTLGRKPDADHLLPVEQMVNWPDNSKTAWYYAQMQEATNSHDYRWMMQSSEKMENWVKKLPDRDWAALERVWSRADSSTGGEVMN